MSGLSVCSTIRQIACAFERVVTHVAQHFDCSIQETDHVSVTCLELSVRPASLSHRNYYRIITTRAIKENNIYFCEAFFIKLFSRQINLKKKKRSLSLILHIFLILKNIIIYIKYILLYIINIKQISLYISINTFSDLTY